MKTINPIKQSPASSAFTIIELLVVIGIIALLAGMVVGLAGPMAAKRDRSRVRAELNRLVMAVEDYKEKKGFYPPDNTNYAQYSPLAYELVGAVYDPVNMNPNTVFTNKARNVTRGTMEGFFKRGGVVNSAPMGAPLPPNFLPTLEGSKLVTLTTNGHLITCLKVPVDRDKGVTNTWRYVSTNPTNNTGTFDLWAEIAIGGKVEIMGNWNK